MAQQWQRHNTSMFFKVLKNQQTFSMPPFARDIWFQEQQYIILIVVKAILSNRPRE